MTDPRHYEGQDLEALADLPNYTTWILDHFAPYLRGRCIEVGAGIGNVSLRYVDRVDEALLIEPAHNLHERLVQRVADKPHVHTVCGLLDEVDAELTVRPFDAALMVNVLEHIQDDAGTLRELYALLRPGGALLVFVPALPVLYGSLDELVHHVRRYTRTTLAHRLRAAGFQIGTLRYFDVLGMLPWFVAGRVLGQRRFDANGARLYDKLVVPVTRRAEEVVPPLLGKSLIAVAFRPQEGPRKGRA